MVTVFGILTLVSVAGVWIFKREWTQYVLGVAVAFPQTAGLLVSLAGLPVFYFALFLIAVLATPLYLQSLARPGKVSSIASRAGSIPDRLILFLAAWGVVITVAGPRIWEGMRVFAPQLGLDAQVAAQALLTPTIGNLAQAGYLILATFFLLAAGRLIPVTHRMLETALWVAIVGAFIRLFTESSWPKELLQNMPSFNYQTSERLSGTFYEPSLLGLHLIAAAGYFGARIFEPRLRTKIASAIALGLVAIDFLANASGTAVLGMIVLGAIAFIVVMVRLTRLRSRSVQPWIFATIAVGTAAVIVAFPYILELTVGTATEKVGSDSYLARSTSNIRSWEIFLETSGLGAGLGANRPSSFFFFVLSTLGAIGVLLLGALIVIALKRTLWRLDPQPAGWGLLGALIAAVIAVPDLSSPVFWTSLTVCLLVPAASTVSPTSAGTPPELLAGPPGKRRSLHRA